MKARPHMTKRREAVCSLLQKASHPLSAAEIAHSLSSQMDQATVYRSLQYLEGMHIVESFLFECRVEGILKYYTYNSGVHTHYFHCEKCHCFIAIERCNSEAITRLEHTHNIVITGHTICYRGICSTCN